MDLNALYYHHQAAIMNGVNLPGDDTGQSQFDLIAHYAKRIRTERSRLGSVRHSWEGSGVGGQAPMSAATGQGA